MLKEPSPPPPGYYGGDEGGQAGEEAPPAAVETAKGDVAGMMAATPRWRRATRAGSAGSDTAEGAGLAQRV
jgi:hypothetical protein